MQTQAARLFVLIGSVSAAIGVAAGAFGAHGLRSSLTPDLLAIYETAVRYQMYHAFGLLVVGWIADWSSTRLAHAAGWCFITGTVLFSGSLYLLTLSGARWWGAVTPVGGIAFIAGWVLLAASAWKQSRA